MGNVLQQAQAANLRSQLALRLLNLREHLIEGVGEQVKFIGARARRSHGVVVAFRHRAGGLCEGLDGPQQPILQAPGYQIGERHRDAAHHDDNEGVQLKARIHGIEIGLDEQNTKLLGSFLDGLKADQGRSAEAIARAGMGGHTLRRESFRVHRENLAAGVVQRGRDDVRIRLESGENTGSIFRVVECQSGGTVAGDGTAQYLQLPDAGLAKRQEFIGAKSARRHQQYNSAREENHAHQRAANGRRRLVHPFIPWRPCRRFPQGGAAWN